MSDASPPASPLLSSLTIRVIDPVHDAKLATANHVETCIASFGSDASFQGADRYIDWLRARVEEYPDGHVMAFRGDEFVGQLELQVPYGMSVGYVNLFYVAPPCRRQGFGRALHDYAERYFRSWEASRIDLHVSPGNDAAVGFYRRMGYQTARVTSQRSGAMYLMSKRLACPVSR
jgi:ribosomal protein S18 acetylase RimI-like enzyme